jgi:hypothetical protein
MRQLSELQMNPTFRTSFVHIDQPPISLLALRSQPEICVEESLVVSIYTRMCVLMRVLVHALTVDACMQ